MWQRLNDYRLVFKLLNHKFIPSLLIKLKAHIGFENESKAFHPLSRDPEVGHGEEGGREYLQSANATMVAQQEPGGSES